MDDVAPSERLATGEADFRDSQFARDADEAKRFLESQDVVPREPLL